MTTDWTTLVADVQLDAGTFLLYLDARSLDSPYGPAEAMHVSSRWELRRALERELRELAPDQPGVLVHITIPDLHGLADLPPDARGLPILELNPRLPEDVLPELHSLPQAAARALTGPGPLEVRLAEAARELTGLAWPPHPDTALLTALRLVRQAGPALRALLLPGVPAGLAADLLAADDPLAALGELLASWGKLGSSHPEHAVLSASGEELLALVADGFVAVPTVLSAELPLGLRLYQPDGTGTSRCLELLANLPGPGTDYDSWAVLADSWAELRWTLAALSPTQADEPAATAAWERWSELDVTWQGWLQSQYATLLSRSELRPASVHKVAPFLAATAVNHGAKVLLLVLDGLGIAQWQHIVARLQLDLLEDRRVLACLPTITTVSRQAIFAGALPTTFPETIERTDTEPQRWRDFWTKQGLLEPETYYQRTNGHTVNDWIDPPSQAIASGIAINAVDDLMHGVSVNGDYQFRAGVATWLSSGFLERAFDWARRNSVQVWVTSDHGNLPCNGLTQPLPNEGVRVTGRGQRVRTYRDELLRSHTPLTGLAWTPPAYPTSAGAPLFAPGRTCFRRGGVTLSHGGLSLDETFVPLARVQP